MDMTYQKANSNVTITKEQTPAEGWFNLTLETKAGEVIGKIGGVPLNDSNPLHAAINAAKGEFSDEVILVVKWNSGTPKRTASDFAKFMKS